MSTLQRSRMLFNSMGDLSEDSINASATFQWRRQELFFWGGHTRVTNFPRKRKKQVVHVFRSWVQNSKTTHDI